MLRNAVRFILLPVQTFLHGMEQATGSFRGMERLPQARHPPLLPGGENLEEPSHMLLEQPQVLEPQVLEQPWGSTDLLPEIAKIDDRFEDKNDNEEKEKRIMHHDDNLSGSGVKVVLYSVVSVATGIDDTARVLFRQPKMIAFGDDMTAADFTAWILSLRSTHEEVCETAKIVCCPELDLRTSSGGLDCGPRAHPCPDPCPEPHPTPDPCRHPHYSILCDPKWHRVAFQVIGRFAVAEINWNELQALAVSAIAHKVNKYFPCEDAPGASEAPTNRNKKG